MFGGAERTTANLLHALDRRSIRRITLAAPKALQSLLPQQYDDFRDTSAYGLSGGFENGRKLLADVRGAAKLLRDVQPDLALGMMHYPSALVALGRRLGGGQIRIVASYRGPFYEYMRRHEQGFRRRLFLRAAVAGTALLADRVIVPSQGTADELHRRFLTPTGRILTIPNGIDFTAVTHAAREPAPELADFDQAEIPVLCAVARLAPEKNLGLLLDAFRRIHAEQPVTLIILGDGPERAALEAQIAAEGLSDAVRLLGHRDNVYPYLHRADVFIHTCQFEGFGYTMLEALACGTAVVATDCPYGPREVLGGGNYGVLVPPDDSQSLATAVLRLLADPTGRQALVARGLKRAEQLSIQNMVGAYETEFLRLAGG
ncbi:MAG: glycosyltransferase [Candidatus Competibacteraceae bacterium]|nr:glycosyltransferase [Candidatus Competibacteraceae bacterium]